MRRVLAGLATSALLLACSGSTSSSSVTTTLPASVVNDGINSANQVIDRLRAAGMPIGDTVPHPTDDPVFQDFDGMLGKVDFRDRRLLSASTASEIDEGVDGGSIEVYRDERAATAASRDRGGYVLVKGPVLLHLAGELAPDWVIAYRDALQKAA